LRFTITSHGVCATIPTATRGVITLAEVEHCFMYVVHDDVVDGFIGPADYIEQVANERRQTVPEARPPLPREEHNQAVLGTSPAFETRPNALAQEHAAAPPAGIGAGPGVIPFTAIVFGSVGSLVFS
jgi:hypothetical protein